MILLLDTHVVLWWRLDSRTLKGPARDAIATAATVFVSAASGWEIAIKRQLGRIQLKDSFAEMVRLSEFEELPVTLEHAEALAALPARHSDPFDRMLIAQAVVERATIVTRDREFAEYGVPLLLA